MLQLLDLGRPDVLAYRSSGVLTETDIRTATEAFDEVLEGRPTVHFYAELEDLKGIEIRALWLDLVYGIRHIGALRHIGRVAFVSDVGWLRRVAEAEALLLPVGTLHTFSMDEREEAQDWIRDAPREEALTHEEVAAWFGPGDYNIIGARGAWFDDRALRQSQSPRRPQRRAPQFGHTIHGTHTLLHAVADRLDTDSTVPAYHALRGVLHALRDRLPAEEAADLAAQLTTLVRGVFYEGYRPGRANQKPSREDFLDAIEREIHRDSGFTAEDAALAVGGALSVSVSDGEWKQVLHALPDEIRSLVDAPVLA